MPHEMLLPLTNFHPSLTSKQFNLFPTPLPRTPKFLIRSCASTSASASASDAQTRTLPKSAIQRIADKLRTLGFTEDAPTPIPNPETGPNENAAGEIFIPLPDRLPKRRVGYTMDTSWSSPENPVPKPGTGSAIARYNALRREVTAQKVMERKERKGNKEERAPTLAELSLSEGELRRLRKIGIEMTKKLKVGKAGITEGIVNGIHERWRSSEVVKIVCEDLCRMNMKRTHDLLERKTGGLVVWRSGSKIVLYRGANYKYPYFLSDEGGENDNSTDALTNLSMDEGGHNKKESCTSSINDQKSTATSPSEKMSQQKLIQGVGMPNRVRFQLPGEAELAEEADCLLEGLGPRYTDWWGYDPLPVDADLLPAIVPGYRRPFRLLPYGVKPVLTNDEMTILKRLGRPLPCHFVLSRNRNLQGLATSILKLWEKCEIAKIAVKRGVQNTNSEMMAEELKRLTGGILLSRDSEFFVLYRGKDFLPPAVSSAIEARRKDGINGERESTTAQKFKFGTTDRDSENDVGGANDEERGLSESDVGGANEEERGLSESDVVGANEEERGLLSEERKLRSKEAAIKRTSIKLSMAIEKKAKAEKILAELETSENLEAPEIDKEGITEEERYMLRKVGLRMRAFLLMGRRGVFDGTIENMHLHWKYREIVKIISKERNIKVVHQEAQILEAESGGILVAVERVNKGYAIIMYRGKNYRRPACLRPQTLLNKREAMKRSIEAQRRKSLKLHVLKLTKNIDELKLELVKDEEANKKQSADELRYKFVKEDMDGMQQAEYLTSQSNPNSGPVIPACFDENTEVKVTHKAHSTPMKLNDGIDISISSLQAPQQDLLIGPSTKPEEDGTGKVGGSSSESVREETRANMFKDMDSEVGAAVSASCPDNLVSEGMRCPAVVRNKATTSPVKPAKIVYEPVPVKVENGLKVNHRASQLSNKERLLLRKQALKMKKRPVLAVGRSNTVAGVAKTIMVHFKKHPLAIVNVKGRAKGTSVQEVVFQLEQATGAVLVSQEPSKVILYRGWGAGDKPGHLEQKNASDPGKEGKTRPTVSPELLAAIRLECGLDGHNKEEVTV